MLQAFIPIIFFIVLFGALIWLYGQRMSTKVSLPPVLPAEGISIPLANAYQGTLFFNVHNGLWARLTLFEDHFEFRIITNKSFSFGEVSEVNCSTSFWRGGNSMQITFNTGAWNYRAYMSKYNLREVLNYFKAKGCNLTQGAEEFLNQPS